jgi:cobalt-zinc-cadmium resistance protein CzcA
LQNLNNELYDIYSKFLNNAQLRYDTGESGKIEVISAKAKVKEIETLKKQLEFDLIRYQNQFQYFLQTTETVVPNAKTALQYEAMQPAGFEKAQGLITGFYEQQAMVFQKEAQTFKAQRIPKLGLGYFGQSLNKEVYFQGFTTGLLIPILGKVNTTRAHAAEISRSQAQLEAEKSKLTFGLQFQQLQNEHEKYKKGVEYFKTEGLQYAEQIIVTAQKSYANGDMSYWMYISFLNQAIDIKKQYAEALNLYNQSAILLQYPSIPNK